MYSLTGVTKKKIERTLIVQLLIFTYCVPHNYICKIWVQDLPRTFPGHPWLDTGEGHAALRRVLVGYSFRDSDVGYCQVCRLGTQCNLLFSICPFW